MKIMNMIQFPKKLHQLHRWRQDRQLYLFDLEKGLVFPIDQLTWDILSLCEDHSTEEVFRELAPKYTRAEIQESLRKLSCLEQFGFLFSNSYLIAEKFSQAEQLSIFVPEGFLLISGWPPQKAVKVGCELADANPDLEFILIDSHLADGFVNQPKNLHTFGVRNFQEKEMLPVFLSAFDLCVAEACPGTPAPLLTEAMAYGNTILGIGEVEFELKNPWQDGIVWIPIATQDADILIEMLLCIASAIAHRAVEGYVAYTAAKGGIISLTRAMAVDGAPYKIRVNCISPGITRTPATPIPDEETERTLATIGLLPYVGEPEDMAHAALWLCSDQTRFITGAIINVDGGWTAK